MTTPSPTPQPADRDVLLKALIRVQLVLDLTHQQLASILGIDSMDGFGPFSETGRRASKLILIYQRLYGYLGANEKVLRHWVKTDNKALGSCPVDTMMTEEGLDRVLDYLNARGA